MAQGRRRQLSNPEAVVQGPQGKTISVPASCLTKCSHLEYMNEHKLSLPTAIIPFSRHSFLAKKKLIITKYNIIQYFLTD